MKVEYTKKREGRLCIDQNKLPKTTYENKLQNNLLTFTYVLEIDCVKKSD